MGGNRWLLIGAALGVAIALGGVPYFAGAAHDLAATALRLVGSGGHQLEAAVAARGAPRRVVLGFTGIIAVLAPGVTAWLLVIAARSALRLRAVVALLLVVLGAASYAYHPGGVATGDIVLAVAVAGLAVAASGPLVVAPLAALAGLIGGADVPALLFHARITPPAARDVHIALFASPGTPLGLRIVLAVVALLPFALALRSLVRR